MKTLLLFFLTVIGALAQGPVAPPTTIYGTVRNLTGGIIDNPEHELIAIYADGIEIGRVPLEWNPESAENYRFDIPNFSVVSTADFTVRLIRDSQPVSIFDSGFAFFIFRPIQGQLRKFDFNERVDLDLDWIPDDLETVNLSFDGDFDHDGLTDMEELAIETDPADWSSGINFKVVRQLPNGDVEVAFDVVTGHVYTLEATNDIGEWTEVSSLTAISDARELVTTTPISGDSVFWRVSVR